MKKKEETATIRVVAPHFVAGLIINEQLICVEAADILKWAIGKPIQELLAYFNKKQWKAKRIV